MVYRGQEEKILRKDESKALIKERIYKIDSLKDYVKSKFKELGIAVPIDENLRIDPNNVIFKEAIEENKINLKKDNEKVEKIEEEFERKEGITAGEALEIFKTYLFNKYFSEELICVRTSKYDDYINKIDNIIVNKTDGEILAALDEVADITSGRFERKFEKVKSANIIGGAIIRYAITYKENKIMPTINLKGVPLILFALPEKVLWSAIDGLDPKNIEYPKDYEKKILEHFGTIIESTISILESEKELLILKKLIEKPEEINSLNYRIEKLKELKKIIDKLKN